MHLTISTAYRFFRSAFPFCWGEYGAVIWWIVPLSARNFFNDDPEYSPPPSVRRTLGGRPNWFFTKLKYSRILDSASDFAFSR